MKGDKVISTLQYFDAYFGASDSGHFSTFTTRNQLVTMATIPYSYIASSQHATGVNHALVGSFTAISDTNLILGKTNRIEIQKVVADGLVPVCDIPINGRISTMQLLKRTKLNESDILIFTTDRYQFAAIEYKESSGDSASSCITIGSGDLSERLARPINGSPICVVDPFYRFILYYFFEGIVHIVPFTNMNFSEKLYKIRIDEVDIVDLCLIPNNKSSISLSSSTNPTLLILNEKNTSMEVNSYTVNIPDKTLEKDENEKVVVSQEIQKLIPVPNSRINGVLMFGRGVCAFQAFPLSRTLSQQQLEPSSLPFVSLSPFNAPFLASWVDSNACFCIDKNGCLTYLSLLTREARPEGQSKPGKEIVYELRSHQVGFFNPPSALVKVSETCLFLGSTRSDSQLLQVSTGETPSASVLKTVQSLGPLMDLAVTELDRKGQSQVLALSGCGSAGSLRVVRSGAAVIEQASLDIVGIADLWTLKTQFANPLHSLLAFSTTNETRFLSLEAEEIEEVDAASLGLVDSETSLLLATLSSGVNVQVTPTKILTSVARSKQLSSFTQFAAAWSPKTAFPGNRITLAASFGNYVLLALSERILVLLRIADAKIEVVTSFQFPFEIAAVSLGNLEEPADVASPSLSSSSSDPVPTFAAVSLWNDFSVSFQYSSKSSASTLIVHTEKLDTTVPAKSVLLTRLAGEPYALVALGDGLLLTYRVNLAYSNAAATAAASESSESTSQSFLDDPRPVYLGTDPIKLVPFVSRGSPAVFACCDRPTVIRSQSGKVVFLNLIIDLAYCMAPCMLSEDQESLAYGSPGGLLLGTIDDVEKLQLSSLYLGEEPRKISHLKKASAILIATDVFVPGGQALGPSAFAPKLNLPSTPASVMESVYAACLTSSAPAETVGVLRLVDDHTLTYLDAPHAFLPKESVCSMVQCSMPREPAMEGFAAPDLGGEREFIDLVVVGTAFVLQEEEEPSSGRLHFFEVVSKPERRLKHVGSRGLNGCPWSLTMICNGRYLVAGVGAHVLVYAWGREALTTPSSKTSPVGFRDETTKSMDSGVVEVVRQDGTDEDVAMSAAEMNRLHESSFYPLCGRSGCTNSLFLDTVGTSNSFFVGDLMKSVALFEFSETDFVVREKYAELSSTWMTSIGALSENVCFGADDAGNLLIFEKEKAKLQQGHRGKLSVVGEFHIGSIVNNILRGSLSSIPTSSIGQSSVEEDLAVIDMDEDTSGAAKKRKSHSQRKPGTGFGPSVEARPELVFGTSGGSIGVVLSLDEPLFRFLACLQWAITSTKAAVGLLSHATYRGYFDMRKPANYYPPTSLYSASYLADPSISGSSHISGVSTSRKCIDGDVIESFLDLNPEMQAKVVASLYGDTLFGLLSTILHKQNANVASWRHPRGNPNETLSPHEVGKVIEELARMH
jgi:Mono-functional DNA-alkylating methyl methanesulfonate N-term/CPSF A subunit region